MCVPWVRKGWRREIRGVGEVNGSCLNLSILFCHIVFLCHVCRRLRLCCSLALCSDLKVPLSLANLLYLRWHSLTFCVSPCPLPLAPFLQCCCCCCGIFKCLLSLLYAPAWALPSLSCRTCLLLVFAEWMDCTCPKAFAYLCPCVAWSCRCLYRCLCCSSYSTPPFPCSKRDCLGCLDLTQSLWLSPVPSLSRSLRLRLHSAVEI